MAPDEQHKLALKLALKAGADKTAALIKDHGSIDEIFESAVAEAGAQRVAEAIVAENDPGWAYNALLRIPDLGNQREALIRQASARRAEPLSGAQPAAAAELTTIGGLQLNLVAGVGFTCQFTMFWISAPGVTQPNAGTPDQGKWKWSITLDAVVNNRYAIQCADFRLPDSPLAESDTVWMVVDINCAARHELPTRFKFGDGPYAVYDTWGVPTNPQFALKSS